MKKKIDWITTMVVVVLAGILALALYNVLGQGGIDPKSIEGLLESAKKALEAVVGAGGSGG